MQVPCMVMSNANASARLMQPSASLPRILTLAQRSLQQPIVPANCCRTTQPDFTLSLLAFSLLAPNTTHPLHFSSPAAIHKHACTYDATPAANLTSLSSRAWLPDWCCAFFCSQLRLCLRKHHTYLTAPTCDSSSPSAAVRSLGVHTSFWNNTLHHHHRFDTTKTPVPLVSPWQAT